MKKLTLFILLATATFTSCSSDDDTISESILIGKWQLVDRFIDDKAIEIDLCELETTVEFWEDRQL